MKQQCAEQGDWHHSGKAQGCIQFQAQMEERRGRAKPGGVGVSPVDILVRGRDALERRRAHLDTVVEGSPSPRPSPWGLIIAHIFAFGSWPGRDATWPAILIMEDGDGRGSVARGLVEGSGTGA